MDWHNFMGWAMAGSFLLHLLSLALFRNHQQAIERLESQLDKGRVSR